MTINSELHVVFGTGPLGLAVMRELATRGKHVRMVNRSGHADMILPDGVVVVSADAGDAESARKVCTEANVVYNCAGADYTRWPELWPPPWAAVMDRRHGWSEPLEHLIHDAFDLGFLVWIYLELFEPFIQPLDLDQRDALDLGTLKAPVNPLPDSSFRNVGIFCR